MTSITDAFAAAVSVLNNTTAQEIIQPALAAIPAPYGAAVSIGVKVLPGLVSLVQAFEGGQIDQGVFLQQWQAQLADGATADAILEAAEAARDAAHAEVATANKPANGA